MIIQNFQFKDENLTPNTNKTEFDLLLCFGARDLINKNDITQLIRDSIPAKNTVFCSTAGEILGNEVFDNSISITGLKFESTSLKTSCVSISDYKDSEEAGKELVSRFATENLKYVLVISDGALVNGSCLVNGMKKELPEDVLITGGLAGNGNAFSSTLVGLNDTISEGLIVAVGFYGNSIKINHGSFGGWEPFGLERTVTKSNSNVLEEIDGKKALDLYKLYLGDYAQQLPGSALLFPLSLTIHGTGEMLVRTILDIDNEKQSMTFAGNIPVGSKVRFMKANFDKLIDAAGLAANEALISSNFQKPQYALLISCIGRKLVLTERTEEEIAAVRDYLGEDCSISGFYSYGEITPINQSNDCQLHNQTMTITTFNEIITEK